MHDLMSKRRVRAAIYPCIVPCGAQQDMIQIISNNKKKKKSAIPSTDGKELEKKGALDTQARSRIHYTHINIYN